MFKNVNGEQVEMTKAEIDEFNARQEAWDLDWKNRNTELFTRALDNLVSNTAQSKGYKTASSCASYISSTNATWVAEAKAFVTWRDSCYEYAFEYFDTMTQDSTIDEFNAGVPAMTWPSASE